MEEFDMIKRSLTGSVEDTYNTTGGVIIGGSKPMASTFVNTDTSKAPPTVTSPQDINTVMNPQTAVATPVAAAPVATGLSTMEIVGISVVILALGGLIYWKMRKKK